MPKKKRGGKLTEPFDLSAISEASKDELCSQWKELKGSDPPPYVSRSLLERIVSYHSQELAFGRMSRGLRSKLDRLVDTYERDPDYRPPSTPIFKPGTRLVRGWRGETHEVTVLVRGFAWKGNVYASLSEVARAITGARWSGPRFFNIKGAADHG